MNKIYPQICYEQSNTHKSVPAEADSGANIIITTTIEIPPSFQ